MFSLPLTLSHHSLGEAGGSTPDPTLLLSPVPARLEGWGEPLQTRRPPLLRCDLGVNPQLPSAGERLRVRLLPAPAEATGEQRVKAEGRLQATTSGTGTQDAEQQLHLNLGGHMKPYIHPCHVPWGSATSLPLSSPGQPGSQLKAAGQPSFRL